MDNRTGFRRLGPAHLAEDARRTLGVALEPRPLADIPPPLVHSAFGAAVCAVTVVLRPDTLGLERSAIACACLAAFTGLAIAAYDRAVYPAERRPALSTTALPVAAVASFATVLAGVSQLWVRITAGVIAALVIGGVPQLIGRELSGRSQQRHRLLRDVAGAAVLAPVLVAGTSPYLHTLSRFALVAAVAALVTFDSLLVERLAGHLAVPLAGATGAVLAGAAVLAGTAPAQSGLRAGVLLVLWYGIRGVAGAFAAGTLRRGVLLAAEYAAFVVVAAGALRWLGLHS